MPRNIKRETATITYHTDERDLLRKLAEKYKCSPFNGECYIDEVSIQKVGQTYHIILTEEQMKEFGEDYIVEEDAGGRKGHGVHQFLLMIKPTLEDNNYIFFRRK